MNCSNCENMFNKTNHIPRLLPSCGHSFCEPCLQSMIQIQLSSCSSSSNILTINCLICHTLTSLDSSNSINQLPKNISLIDSIADLSNIINSNTSRLEPNQYNKKKCSIHNKDLEVFCENDSKLLCVNCLLEKSHLSHQLFTIDEGIKKEKEKIDIAYEMLIAKDKMVKESIATIEQKMTIANEDGIELIKNANDFYDDIIEKITANRNKLMDNINKCIEANDQYLIKKKEQFATYIKVIESAKEKETCNVKDNEIDSLLCLKETNKIIDEIVNIEEKDLFINSNTKNMVDRHREIEKIKHELDEYRKDKNINEIYDREGDRDKVCDEEEKDGEGNQSNGKITNSNTNQDILITNASSNNNEPNSIETNTIIPINNNITQNQNENQRRIHISIIDMDDKTDINKLSNSSNQLDNNQKDSKCIEYIDINNQSTFKFTKGSTIKLSPQKNYMHKPLFPPFKSSSSNQLNQFGAFKGVNSLVYSNFSDDDSINYSSSQLMKFDQLNNMEIENQSTPEDQKRGKPKSQCLFNTSLIQDVSTNNHISPFLRNYLLENNTELGSGLNYTSSIISNNNQQDISALYKETTTSYIFIGGKSDTITRQWCMDTFQWSTIAKQISNGIKDLVVERSDFVLLKYKEKKTLIVGGKVNINGMESLTDSIQLLDIEKKTLDKLDFKLKTPKCAFSGLYLQSQIFIAGGSDGRFVLNSFEFFDKKPKQWFDLPKMFYKRKHFAMIASFDNCIFAIGGQDERGNILKSVEKYDINKRLWIKVKEMNQSRRSSSAVCMPDGIYVIGGYDGAQYLKSVEKYDFMTKKWVYLSDMNYTKSDFCVMASIDCRYIYSFGGYNGRPLNAIEQFDILANQWKHVASMPIARYKHHVIEDLSELNNQRKN